jgi:hypothetical protein
LANTGWLWADHPSHIRTYNRLSNLRVFNHSQSLLSKSVYRGRAVDWPDQLPERAEPFTEDNGWAIRLAMGGSVMASGSRPSTARIGGGDHRNGWQIRIPIPDGGRITIRRWVGSCCTAS